MSPVCIRLCVNHKQTHTVMMNAAIKKSQVASADQVLNLIFHKAEAEYREIEEMLALLGWSDLPKELQMVIEEDVKGYIDELKGQYCTNSEWVQRRRESVDFWVNSYMDGICSLETAVTSLRVNKL